MFACEDRDIIFNIYASFYADSIGSLTEQICEYQENLEETSHLIVVYKEVREIEQEVKC
jgi:hypothetical protein